MTRSHHCLRKVRDDINTEDANFSSHRLSVRAAGNDWGAALRGVS